ncbi:type I-D CRISPR-associated protein Cas10d/Csc3 [Dapis sp. BLCC M126]|uniref:type I-D CRISPR-associated protein Cas10d/Csc3 n=1 Tax=Dapis sp. BLCC M126 TaxID=3400189 RepID=UPI003CF3997C
MARKNKKSSNDFEQLSLFEMTEIQENINPEPIDDSDDDWLEDEELGLSFEQTNRDIEPTHKELLTLQLLREAIIDKNRDDLVIREFAKYVLPNLLKFAIGVTAKGGKFFDRIDFRREAEGKTKVRRDNAADQSLNTHILNGLFPANLIAQRLEELDTTVKREMARDKEIKRRILIAGFLLHDFEKFKYNLFPGMPEKYVDIDKNSDQDIRKLSIAEHQEIFRVMVPLLGLDKLINPEKPEGWVEYLEDLLFIAYNTQKRNDTNLNLSESGLNPKLPDRSLICLSNLTLLADLLSSIIKHPQDAKNSSLHNIIHQLSDGKLELSYHSIAENRGVLTNIVNNAVMAAYQNLNTEEEKYYQPLLYLPTGVIYLTQKNAPPISEENLPELVVSKIKELCAKQLRLRQTGFGRDGKGMKYAEYYNLFFDTVSLIEVALEATLRILHPGKKSVAKSRSDNLVKFQQQQILSADYNFQFDDDLRIDQIAEFGDVMTRNIWGEVVNNIDKLRKQNKDLPELPANLETKNLVHQIPEYWELSAYIPQIREIQNINESLKEQKLKGNTGGVPYDWYFLAAKYLESNPGVEDVKEICQKTISHISQLIQPVLEQYKFADGWDDLREWVKQVVMLPGKTEITKTSAEVFFDELSNYQLAKKPGRGRKLICSISHSPYSVTEQMESAVLFTPQVYTNKQMLGGSNAKRNISNIAGIEMMLRQILMNQTQATGKKFEDSKYRYLYFYPTYYCTPETNKFLQKAYSDIAQTRFDTSIRNHFINRDFQANFTREKYQSVDTFLIDENLEPEKDRTFKLSYPEDQPLTFYFMAMPPGKGDTDTESWVMPSWLAFAFPMILDIKTVVSESPIPPFNDGSEFEETVFLDTAPQAFRSLVRGDRFRLDYILEGWEENGKEYPAPLNVLTAAYAIHLDVNAKVGKGGYDANWGKLTELAKDFETSPLYVFSYLNKWVRNQKVETARIEKIKLYTYYFYPCFDPNVKYNQEKENLEIMEKESSLNHPQKLTELYREFYRANKKYNPKTNAVLKPLDVAKDVILNADPSFQNETLVNAVAAEVSKLMDRVHASTAEGRWIFKKREEERKAILKFASYFVKDVFYETFAGDRARLSGRQINLIRDTCEFLYRLENDRENQENPNQVDDESE